MKLNEKTVIIGEKIVLVPYKKHHVRKYHSWMQKSDLQKLTASEPLSLQEEYDMQKTWHEDETKLTFIIMNKDKWKKCGLFTDLGYRIELCDIIESNNDSKDGPPFFTEIDCMVGDVNLFCIDGSWLNGAEISLMIAESDYHRLGYGTEAAMLMMNYGMKKLDITTFTAKIGLDNNASEQLFLKKLNFIKLEESKVFNEATLQYKINNEAKSNAIEKLTCCNVDYVYL